MTPEEEAIQICDELDVIGDELKEEGDIERGGAIKTKILRLRQLIAAM